MTCSVGLFANPEDMIGSLDNASEVIVLLIRDWVTTARYHDVLSIATSKKWCGQRDSNLGYELGRVC